MPPLKYPTRPLSSLTTWEQNPRSIDKKDFQRLKDLITKLGLFKPFIITDDGTVLGGNMRLRAARELGITDAPVSVVKAETEQEKLEYALADNDRVGSYDEEKLAELVLNSPEINLELFHVDLGKSISLEDVSQRFGPDPEEDEVPEVSTEEPISKLGEVYQLGRHRLMCGDSTKIEDVEKLMDGKKADMVFTDPPYGMDLDTDYSKLPSTKKEGNKTYSKVIGDSEEFDPTFILNTFDYCNEIVMFGADYYADKLPKGGSWFVWDKRVDEKFDKMIGSAFELAWSKNKHKREIARFNNTLFSGESDAKNKVHPTQKPLKMLVWFLNRLKGNNVVDLFGGSGSTLIACEQTDRTCYMMELDPKYCDVIRKRYENFTTKTGEKQDA